VTEMVVVIGIVSLLASLLLPVIFRARTKARMIQCTSQLRQIHQAITMYDIDHDRDFENYPDRITHLVKLGYVADGRLFVCPMDYTKATKDTLKPGNPKEKVTSWAERYNHTYDTEDTTGMPTYNCSYLYEFSTRKCDTYSDPDDELSWSDPYSFASTVLVGWDENWSTGYPPLPSDADRDHNGILTWQEAKFWQLNNADMYATGWSAPGDPGIPSSWSPDPFDQIADGTSTPQRHYNRTWLPILRCFWHMTPATVDDERTEEVLNIAVDGNMFFSAPGWEQTSWKYGRLYDEDIY
jgi:type II secretory pathway pseudopilin PulG